jgi:hypothetical protein
VTSGQGLGMVGGPGCSAGPLCEEGSGKVSSLCGVSSWQLFRQPPIPIFLDCGAKRCLLLAICLADQLAQATIN